MQVLQGSLISFVSLHDSVAFAVFALKSCERSAPEMFPVFQTTAKLQYRASRGVVLLRCRVWGME